LRDPSRIVSCRSVLTTRQKIAVARLCQGPLVALRRTLGLDDHVLVRRGGLRWRVDLAEGIDFSIYLLGAFERRVARAFRRLVRPGSTVLDVGANVGAHTLPLARLVGPDGRVLAFEPTDWAFAKLTANVALNRDLAPRIRLEQLFLTERDDAHAPERVFSSWPLEPTPDVHPRLRGRAMAAGTARAMTLDTASERAGARKIDFIKIDVDGYEPDVLAGAARVLRRDGPTVLVELAPYLLEERGLGPDAVLQPLRAAGYVLSDMDRDQPLTAKSVGRLARGQAMNVVARPAAAERSPTGTAAV